MVIEVVGSQAAAPSAKHNAGAPLPVSTVSPGAPDSALPSATPAKPVTGESQQVPVTSANIPELVDSINERPQVRERSLQFSVHEGTGKTQVRIYDSKTHELIRQIPSDEMLRIAERIDEVLTEESLGMILQEKA